MGRPETFGGPGLPFTARLCWEYCNLIADSRLPPPTPAKERKARTLADTGKFPVSNLSNYGPRYVQRVAEAWPHNQTVTVSYVLYLSAQRSVVGSRSVRNPRQLHESLVNA